MSPVRLPSLDIPEDEKRRLSEADVHSTLFEPDLRLLGYPPRTSSQADGEHFLEQRTLAVRRLRSRRSTGRYDGLYLIGNAPVVLCELRDVARGRQGLATADDRRFLAGIGAPFPGLVKVIANTEVARGLTDEERSRGIAPNRPHWVPFAKGEGFGEYWREPRVAIDWSRESVAELERRDALPAGTSRRPRLQNRSYYFRTGLTYSVVASGRLSVRLLPEGWIFGHKGSAVFVEGGATSDLFLLGYLNSALATYFMRKIVNTTATADVGYIEKLPYRRPPANLEAAVAERVSRIVEALQADPEADVEPLRDEIDEATFDLFEIRSARDEVRRFYRAVGRAEPASSGGETRA